MSQGREKKPFGLLWIFMQHQEDVGECSLYKGAWAWGQWLPLHGCKGCLGCSISWVAPFPASQKNLSWGDLYPGREHRQEKRCCFASPLPA